MNVGTISNYQLSCLSIVAKILHDTPLHTLCKEQKLQHFASSLLNALGDEKGARQSKIQAESFDAP